NRGGAGAGDGASSPREIIADRERRRVGDGAGVLLKVLDREVNVDGQTVKGTRLAIETGTVERRAVVEDIAAAVKVDRAACGHVEGASADAAALQGEGAGIDIDRAAVVEQVAEEEGRAGGAALGEGAAEVGG